MVGFAHTLIDSNFVGFYQYKNKNFDMIFAHVKMKVASQVTLDRANFIYTLNFRVSKRIQG